MKINGLQKYRETLKNNPPLPVERKNMIEKWRAKNTRRNAINAFCCECMGATAEDFTGIRNLVSECTSKLCPLYDWRPYKQRQETAIDG